MSPQLSIWTNLAGLAFVAFIASGATAQVRVSIDMDPTSEGIQDTIEATTGQSLRVDVMFDVGPEGLSSFGVSLQFDTLELSFADGSAATELLPGGFDFNLTPGVAAILEDIGGGLGQVSTFEAATLSAGPTDSMFVIGTVDFMVDNPLDDGLADVMPGLFNSGIDGFFDNAGIPIEPLFNPGFVVPEPSSLALLAVGAIAILRRCRVA